MRTLALILLLAAPAFGQLRPWNDYRVIMWVSKPPADFARFVQNLREMGVNTGMVFGDADPQPWVDAGFPYYVENIVNRGLCLKWNSKVRDWDAFVENWKKTRSEATFVREYCLDDPAWREWAKNQMRAVVRKNALHHPLAYNIRDELSITMSANPFDYCFCPKTQAAFRAWLKTQYRDLAELNARWETDFKNWDEVRPFSTDEIKRRKNSTPWCDFRTYMDVSLARVIDELRQVAHEIDPYTPVGIEGTQMPAAFGGYDLYRLSQVIDWVEPYDVAGARAIFGSFMPGKPILSTVSDPATARQQLWHRLLEGDRGCIVWWSEDCFDADFNLTAKAKALAPALNEMTSPLAQIFVHAQREYDPVTILYSQRDIQEDWLEESIPDGKTWVRRFSSYEAEHNRLAKTRVDCLHALQQLGFSPRFVVSNATIRIQPGMTNWADHEAGLRPFVKLSAPATVYRYKLGNARIVAFEGVTKPITGTLAEPAYVYDLRTGKSAGRTDRLEITGDYAAFALLPAPLPGTNVVEALLQ